MEIENDFFIEKENTKRVKYSFKKNPKGICQLSDFYYNLERDDYKGQFIVERECYKKLNEKYNIMCLRYSSIIYYAKNDNDYIISKNKLDNEISLLFNQELDYIISEYPILLNDKRTEEEIYNFYDSENFKDVLSKITNIICNLNEDNFVFIPEFIDKLVELKHPMTTEIIFEDYKYNIIYTILKCNFVCNNNLKKIFKVETHKKADYLYRQRQYESKSVNYNENKFRDWRRNSENYRRRKERRERKQNVYE